MNLENSPDVDEPEWFESNRTAWYYNGVPMSNKSSLIVAARSLLSKRAYRFQVRINNRRDPSIEAVGFLIVNVVDAYSPMVTVE